MYMKALNNYKLGFGEYFRVIMCIFRDFDNESNFSLR